MNQASVGEVLKQLIEGSNSKLSLRELSKRTSIPQPTLTHILSGKTKKPRSDVLEALANFFSVSVSQLTGEFPLHGIPETIKASLKISTVPLIEWEMVKNWKNKEIKYGNFKEIILDRQVDVHSFALVMQDHSMEPMFPKNSILIFDSGKKPKDREYVIAYLSNTDNIIFNRFFFEQSEAFIKKDQIDGNAQLIKINPATDEIIATLIEVRMQF